MIEELNGNVDLYNVSLRKLIGKIDHCRWCDNINLSYRGKPKYGFFLHQDGVHLSQQGVFEFTYNLQDALGIKPYRNGW